VLPRSMESQRSRLARRHKIRVFKHLEERNLEVCRMTIYSKRNFFREKWVFNKKKNRIYRAKLIALGYSQVLGVSFYDCFSPLTKDK